MSPLRHPALQRGIGTEYLRTYTWSRPEQAHRLPGALLPNHEAANDETKRASPRCFQLNSRATVPIGRRALGYHLVVCRLANTYNPLMYTVLFKGHLI